MNTNGSKFKTDYSGPVSTSGKPKNPNTNELVDLKRFYSIKKLLEKFKVEYDFVLLYSTPFGIIGDVSPILQLTDGVIVNSKFMATKHIELNYTIDQLEKNSAHIIGVVLSGYKPEKSIDDTEVKGLYSNLYSSYYDYHETPTKKKKKSNVKFL
jgi:Mrp family chromosome partitioning ATPase